MRVDDSYLVGIKATPIHPTVQTSQAIPTAIHFCRHNICRNGIACDASEFIEGSVSVRQAWYSAVEGSVVIVPQQIALLGGHRSLLEQALWNN
jgi:hypothetical protein